MSPVQTSYLSRLRCCYCVRVRWAGTSYLVTAIDCSLFLTGSSTVTTCLPDSSAASIRLEKKMGCYRDPFASLQHLEPFSRGGSLTAERLRVDCLRVCRYEPRALIENSLSRQCRNYIRQTHPLASSNTRLTPLNYRASGLASWSAGLKQNKYISRLWL